MVWGFSEDKAAALDAPRTEPYTGKGAFFICISITGASRLKCYNKEGKYILIYLWFGSLTAVRNVPLFAAREAFPAISCFMCFGAVKKGLVCTLLVSNSSFPGL